MDTLMPNGFVANTFSFGAADESAAFAVAASSATTRPEISVLALILSLIPFLLPSASVRFLGHDLRLLRRLRGLMHHRVGVLDAGAIGAALLLEDGHERVVVLL